MTKYMAALLLFPITALAGGPAALNLTASPMNPGVEGSFTVDGAGVGLAPGVAVWFMKGASEGGGGCPAYLGGGCWDITGPTFKQVAWTDGGGVATWSFTVDAGMAPGTMASFQSAVDDAAGVRISNPVTVTVEVPGGPGDCASHPQWTPVSCTIASWVWSSDRTYLDIPSADAAEVLWSGCTHSGDGNDDGMCSLDGAGWVSTDTFVMADCNASWYHLGGSYTGNCGGHDGDTVRHLVKDPAGCYDY